MRSDEKIICEEYLDFVREHPCACCFKGPVDAHHLVARGWRESKRNDFTAVPLCRGCHSLYHNKGLAGIQYIGINLWKAAWELTTEFFITHSTPQITFGKLTELKRAN